MFKGSKISNIAGIGIVESNLQLWTSFFNQQNKMSSLELSHRTPNRVIVPYIQDTKH
jgi:hypothetical protein